MIGTGDGLRDGDVCRLARELYRDTAVITRLQQMGRPFICPFDKLGVHVPPGSRLLDIGCGAGLFVLSLASAGRIVSALAVDTNAAGITAAKAALQRLPAKCDVRFATIGPDDPLPAGIFDVISLIDVTHHVPVSAQQIFLERVVQHVPPGGVLLYKDMCDAPAWKAWGNRLHDLVVARQRINYVPLEMMESIGMKGGLHALHKDSYTRFFYGHELLVLERPSNGPPA